MIRTKALAVATLLALSSAVFVAPQASANHDPFDTGPDFCTLALDPPVMTGTTTATATATYACGLPRKHMTIQVWIEVFRPLAGGYQTVASAGSTSGSTAVPFLTEQVSGTVCLSGATQMRARATGHWVDSHGVQRAVHFGESPPVPLACSIRL